jgi:hypothetical protein
MTTRETDTSASEATTDGSTAAETADAGDRDAQSEALFDRLVAEDVLAVGDDGAVRTTDEFDDTHAVYHDSYVGVPEAEFHAAVAATFGLPDAASAAELVEARGVEREEFVCYLAVRSQVGAGPGSDTDVRAETDPDDAPGSDGRENDLSPDDLAAMAGMVAEVVPDSPVPPAVADVTDDPDSFVAGRDRAVVSVWKRFCDPCDAVKADLESILDVVPGDAAVAGLDGEVATGFCQTHGVESAPGFVVFRNGEGVRTVTGSDPDQVIDALQTLYSG